MSNTEADASDKTMHIDIASDVVCPWCLIGYKQLERALKDTGTKAEIKWHPFELNPRMPEQGEDLQQHLTEKYAKTREENREAMKGFPTSGPDLVSSSTSRRATR